MSPSFPPGYAPPPASAPWRADVLGDAQGGPGLRWVLRRNCSLAPRQVLAAYSMLCAVSFLIAGGFAWMGATPVLYFAGIEMALVGLALILYARHATDHETITLKNSMLSVEHHCGARVDRAEFRADWLRIEPAQAQGSLLELSGAGQRTLVGRYLRPEWRQALAHELRQALRLQGPAGPVTQGF